MPEWPIDFHASMMRDGDTRHLEAAAVALLKLVEYGVPTDVQGLLVDGSRRAGVRPGALTAALSAALGVYMKFDNASSDHGTSCSSRSK